MKTGDRVYAIQSADQQKVFAFGPGVYQGDLPCTALGGIPNPQIVLDSGGIVWGYQCWWGAEAGAEGYIAGRDVITVPAIEKVSN